MAWLILLALILFFMLWLMLAPIYLYISTADGRYEAGLKGLIRLRLLIQEGSWPVIRMRLLLIGFNIPLVSYRKENNKNKERKASQKKRRLKLKPRKVLYLIRLGWKIFRSFRLKKLHVNIDTGDVIRNAWLYPAGTMPWGDRIRFSVNFQHRNELVLLVQNNLLTILTRIISNFISHKFKRIFHGI